MSRFWRDVSCSKLGQCDERVKQRNKPNFIRLDSTGEVSSDSVKPTKMCHGKKPCSFASKDGNCLKNLVGNLKMGSVIDTASTYLDSASSYLGGFCSYKSGLVDNQNNPLKYFQGIFDSNKIESTSRPRSCAADNILNSIGRAADCTMANNVKQFHLPQGNTCNWSDNFLGSVHRGFRHKRMPCDMNPEGDKREGPEPYRPPHLKNKMNCQAKDPNLTPYNARLLEKSKHTHQVKSENKPHKKQLFQQNKTCDIPKCEMDTIDITSATLVNNEEKTTKDATDNVSSITEDDPDADSVQSEKPHDESPDWFEYESDNPKIIPITIKANTVELEEASDEQSDINQCKEMLHSWLSMDYDADVCKINNVSKECSSSSQNKQDSETQQDNKSAADINSVNCDKPPSAETTFSELKENANEMGHQCSEKSNMHKSKISAEVAQQLISVLYLRNCQKKIRPSSKKRKRHRAQQKEKNNLSCQKDGNCQGNSNKKANNSVAFILGSDSAKSSHSFLMSCDIGSDSDWSDSDIDCDESTSDDEVQFQDQFGLLSPLMNFNVTCSIQPSTDANKQNNCTIDAINLSWQVNISVDSHASTKKSNSTKKVHFADNNKLASVHPIIAWSYAYRAARKGPWETYARDRGRFLRRITDGEKLLRPIFQTQHRDKIFCDRFNMSTQK